MGLINWISGFVADMRGHARDVAKDTRGNVAMILGLVMPVLVLLTMGGIDIHRLATVRANLQDALDAAALAAARSPYVKTDDLNRVGRAALKANLAGYSQITLTDTDVTFALDSSQTVIANAKVDVKTIAAHIFLPPYGQLLDEWIPVQAHSEVTRATNDIEVALVLDITGSMAGQRLSDLQTAAKDLVDLVVQDNQDINSTRMALVPYSMGVNAGSYLNAARGAARGSTNITGAAWMVANSQKTLSAMTKASPGVFTATSHGYATGDFVWISGVTDANNSGQTDLATLLNSKIFKVVKLSNDTFSLQTVSGTAVNTTGYQTYTASSGIARRCLISTCEVVVTAANHGLSTGEDVRMLSVGGMTQLNTQNSVTPTGVYTATSNAPYKIVTKLTDSTFSIDGLVGPAVPVNNYTSGGTVQCLEYGCTNFLFTNNEDDLRVFTASSCVSERVGPNAYTDVAPSTTPVAFSYVNPTANVGNGGCMTTTLTPLTTDRAALKSAINGYTAEGGTAGQIGVGWGWYMVSPTFSTIFPSSQQPQAYGTRNLLKVVILMTDGEFNAVYYNGVRARDSGTGGGSDDRWINHDSNNGNPFAQAANMCTAMKAKDIIIYTVGFDITSTNNNTPGINTAQKLMQFCASTPDHVFLPENGASLKSAFAAIGRSISQLRISK